LKLKLINNIERTVMDNRYGVDVKYFEKTVKREMAGLKDQTPSDLARVFARLSRTSDRSVVLEPEFAKKHIDRIEALEQENAKLRKGIKTVRILIDESHGVAGLHLNGEIAAWDTLELGGWAEEWLIDFNESEIALALHKEGES
jgi:hypothetical protein